MVRELMKPAAQNWYSGQICTVTLAFSYFPVAWKKTGELNFRNQQCANAGEGDALLCPSTSIPCDPSVVPCTDIAKRGAGGEGGDGYGDRWSVEQVIGSEGRERESERGGGSGEEEVLDLHRLGAPSERASACRGRAWRAADTITGGMRAQSVSWWAQTIFVVRLFVHCFFWVTRFAKKIWHGRHEPREDEMRLPVVRGFARLTDSDSAVSLSSSLCSAVPFFVRQCCCLIRQDSRSRSVFGIGSGDSWAFHHLKWAVWRAKRPNRKPNSSSALRARTSGSMWFLRRACGVRFDCHSTLCKITAEMHSECWVRATVWEKNQKGPRCKFRNLRRKIDDSTT